MSQHKKEVKDIYEDIINSIDKFEDKQHILNSINLIEMETYVADYYYIIEREYNKSLTFYKKTLFCIKFVSKY